ncbi:MAG: YdiU family protein [Saprospiraceae bacterium]
MIKSRSARILAEREGLSLKLEDHFSKELPADPLTTNERRQVKGACFSTVVPRIPSKPVLVHASAKTADLVGIEEKELNSDAFLKVFSGKELLPNSSPYAMCYGGHQFGHWAGQLGDGRAINLAEVSHAGKRWALQLKGSGETPYSRTADGLAVLRSSVREHLCSEAMYHLGVPTSRSLSLMLTGDDVLRDVMYDGNPAYEKGAVVCRVATSFLRFGSFEIHAANRDQATLTSLVDYTIRHHFPDLEAGAKQGYAAFFKSVCERSLTMVMHWQRVGFVHGVMNTDNMSILGDTIDYGPYGWLEGYDPNWTPNTTDRQHRRYRYGNQPEMVFWNLHKLANALYVLVGEEKPFVDALEWYKNEFAIRDHAMHLSKLGLTGVEPRDADLIAELKEVLILVETDMTIFFRRLADCEKESAQDGLETVRDAFYAPDSLEGDVLARWKEWFTAYGIRLRKEARVDELRKSEMNAINPKYVLRNYMVQLAIDAADKGDFNLVKELYELSLKPYDEQREMEKWFDKRPEWARSKVGCSMLSCSS